MMNLRERSRKEMIGASVLMLIVFAVLGGFFYPIMKGAENPVSDRVLLSQRLRAETNEDRLAEDGGLNLVEGGFLEMDGIGDAEQQEVSARELAEILRIKASMAGAGKLNGGGEEDEFLLENAGLGSGLREKLLQKASTLALHSESPSSDLALVALAYYRFGDEETARYWFHRAGSMAAVPNDSIKTSKALREVVARVLAAKMVDLAEDLIAQMSDVNEKSRAQAELVKFYARAQDFEAARDLAYRLEGEVGRALAIRSLAEAEARHLGILEAQQTLQQISHVAERDRAYQAVANIRASMGDADGAMNLIWQIENERTREAAQVKLEEVLQSKGSLSTDALLGLLRDPNFREKSMRALVQKEITRLGLDRFSPANDRLENDLMRSKAQESLVILQIREGDTQGALGRAKMIQVDEVRDRALQMVSLAEAKKGGTRVALKITELIMDQDLREKNLGKIAAEGGGKQGLSSALRTIEMISEPSVRALTYAQVALKQADRGETHEAWFLAENASRELPQVTSHRDRAQAVGLVAEVFAKTGNHAQAFGMAESIANAGLRDATFQKVALTFAKASEAALASQSAHQIERETTRERAMDSIATALATGVRPSDAMRFLPQLEGRSQQVRFLLGVAQRAS